MLAAALADPDAHGELRQRMDEWVGKGPEPTSIDQVSDRLIELGSGSSAVVVCFWKGGGAHYFNAVNDAGQIKAVDGQSGRVGLWPPSVEGLGFSEEDMSEAWVYLLGQEEEPADVRDRS